MEVVNRTGNDVEKMHVVNNFPFSHRKNIRKVLLIQPPAWCNNIRSDMNPNAPLGIAYIAAVLEKHEYDVKILDAFIEGWDVEIRLNKERIRVGLSFEEIRERIVSENPDVVGITSMFTSQRKNAHQVAQIVKSIDRNITVIFGGAHATAAPESVLEDINVNVVVLGEGDNTIIPLLKTIESNSSFAEIDGIAYKNEEGNLVIQEKVIQINNLDDLPFPARHLLPMERYFEAEVRHGGKSRNRRAASIITSRGCQYRCNFCTAFKVFTRTPRLRSVENIIAEIEELVNKFSVDEIWFEDDQLIAKQRQRGELFDQMAQKFNLQWDTPNGVSVWLLNEDLIQKMKASGCYCVNLAIESGNQEVLKEIINKPVNLSKVPEVVKLIQKYDMEVGTFLVVGNISHNRVETLEEIKDSFRFARKMRVDPHVSYLTAYPGSETLEVAKAKNYLIDGFDWDDLVIQKQQLQTPEWSPQELRNLVEKEIIKTRLWKWLTSPKWLILKTLQVLIKNPIGGINILNEIIRNSLKLIFNHKNVIYSTSTPDKK